MQHDEFVSAGYGSCIFVVRGSSFGRLSGLGKQRLKQDIKKTCRELGVSFWHLLRSRLTFDDTVLPLPELIRKKTPFPFPPNLQANSCCSFSPSHRLLSYCLLSDTMMEIYAVSKPTPEIETMRKDFVPLVC
jgi:hypothetical protein